MSFIEAIQSGATNAVNFGGRATRSEFWFWILFVWVVWFGAIFSIGFVASAVGFYQEFILLLLIALAISSVSIAVRRLHDLNKSALNLFWYIVPFGVLYLLYLYCQDSDPLDNDYGSMR